MLPDLSALHADPIATEAFGLGLGNLAQQAGKTQAAGHCLILQRLTRVVVQSD
jgi:hypothetical protein